ncbi:MAG: MarR family winged helix-turn-helix transcriptional regulator [Stackebrandtia sp.]
MPVPDWISTWDDDFQPAFWMAKHAMVRAAEATFQRFGVRQGQQYVLMCLWHRDGQTPGELAAAIGLATPTVTRTTARMEKTGLVKRTAHPTDRRLVCVNLTPEGQRLREVLNAEVSRLSDRALSGLSAEERASLVTMLHTVRRNLS